MLVREDGHGRPRGGPRDLRGRQGAQLARARERGEAAAPRPVARVERRAGVDHVRVLRRLRGPDEAQALPAQAREPEHARAGQAAAPGFDARSRPRAAPGLGRADARERVEAPRARVGAHPQGRQHLRGHARLRARRRDGRGRQRHERRRVEARADRGRLWAAGHRVRRGPEDGPRLCANQIFNPTSMCAYATVSTQSFLQCFENSTRAIDPSKNQPNRLRFDRARDF